MATGTEMGADGAAERTAGRRCYKKNQSRLKIKFKKTFIDRY